MEDPLPWWEQRVKHARAAPAAPEVGFPGFFGLDGREFDEKFDESFPTGGFWTLIHPSIREEVSRRFAIHEYADAVMAALQVVAHTVREKTGIREDGARLMANAFGGDRPYLVFDDPMPQTQQAMQSGYRYCAKRAKVIRTFVSSLRASRCARQQSRKAQQSSLILKSMLRVWCA
jgi:uncharacterized protein (TIGR02391 family)